MFNLNPAGNPDALWQHAVMIIVSAIIGYALGYVGIRRKEHRLKGKLAKLDSDLENCRLKNTPFIQNTIEIPSSQIQQIDKKPDDLKVIEGIDQQIEKLLNSEGIYTFHKLSETNAESLMKILKNSGSLFRTHYPHTWPQQAELASLNKWEQLTELKNELNKSHHQ